MPTITNATIAIAIGLPGNKAKVTVAAQIRFSPFELFLMKNGLRFSLGCNVWGEDLGQGNWLNADDFIFSYATKFFPDATPTGVESVTFDATVNRSILDEDLGTDEVYGQLTLKNLHDGSMVKAKTNVVKHSF